MVLDSQAQTSMLVDDRAVAKTKTVAAQWRMITEKDCRPALFRIGYFWVVRQVVILPNQ
jgi:hypothetical protein